MKDYKKSLKYCESWKLKEDNTISRVSYTIKASGRGLINNEQIKEIAETMIKCLQKRPLLWYSYVKSMPLNRLCNI